MFTVEFRSYTYSKYKKSVQSTIGFIWHINACKIQISLPSWQLFTHVSILEYNTINHIDLLLDKFEDDINSEVSKYDKEKIRSADTIRNNDRNSRVANMNNQRLTTPNWTS